MKPDVPTLVFILGLASITQVIAIFIQHRLNRTYRGTGGWLLGSALMGAGLFSLGLGRTSHLWPLSNIGNPLLVLGRICFLTGTLRFLERKENFAAMGAAFAVFLGLYYHYLFGHPDLAARTVVVSAAIALYSFWIAHVLLFGLPRPIRGSARFTGTVFLAHGLFMLAVIGDTLLTRPVRSITEYSLLQVSAFIAPIVTSTLWTFGFILMANQRLNAENQEERENLQQVFNTSPDSALITRLSDGTIVDANLGFSALSGHSRAESLGSTTDDLALWAEPQEHARFLAEIDQERHCENREYRFQRKDGRRLVGLVSARIIAINDQPHLVSVTRDITEQKHAEDVLRESEETYRSILKASPDGITITDLDGRILLSSPEACRIFGHAQGEGESVDLLEFVAPEDRARARSTLQRLRQGTQPGPGEYRGLRQDGSLVEMEVNCGLIHGGQGQAVKMVFIVRDISERRKAEAERAALESRNRQLQKSESLGRMAGAIAHHFNNQLQTVMANLELMSRGPEAQELGKWLAGARRASERAADVSRLMLAYLGQTAREQEPTFLADLCRQALPVIQDTLSELGEVETELPVPGPIVRANTGQLRQVLANLLLNAREAMGEGRGGIRLRLGTCWAAEIPAVHRFPVSWTPGEVEHAFLEVADSGCGIAEPDLEKLFDPFFSTKFVGRGLGLSVVLGIVQAHGGAVTVESRTGRGSTFRVYLPVCSEGVPTLPELAQRVSELQGAGTVLLVDDDPSLLESTGAVLEMLGFGLLTARDGLEALEVFRQHRGRIRCVITDLTMPRMDGWETLAALRQLDPALPVILASGYDREQIMAETRPDRPSAFLAKPFNLRGLREALGQALSDRTVA